MIATTALESARWSSIRAKVVLSNRSVRERKSDVLLVVPDDDFKHFCLEDIERRRDVIRSLPGPLFGFPVVCRVVSDDMSNSRERKMIAHHHDLIGGDAVQNGLARLDRLRGIVVEDGRPFGVLQTRHRVMGDVTHMDELLLARGEQDCGMGRRMSRRRNIVHAGCDFAALLHEPGSGGDRGQVISSCPNRALLELVGHRRTVDLTFVTAAGPVVPLRVDKDELSLRKGQRARFRHKAADMVQMTVRRHDQIYALGRDSGPAQIRVEPGKATEGWAEFLANTGASSASETFIARIGRIGICPEPSEITVAWKSPILKR